MIVNASTAILCLQDFSNINFEFSSDYPIVVNVENLSTVFLNSILPIFIMFSIKVYLCRYFIHINRSIQSNIDRYNFLYLCLF